MKVIEGQRPASSTSTLSSQFKKIKNWLLQSVDSVVMANIFVSEAGCRHCLTATFTEVALGIHGASGSRVEAVNPGGTQKWCILRVVEADHHVIAAKRGKLSDCC